MTSPETRLRDVLRDAGSAPVGRIDFDQLAHRHQRRARGRWAIGGGAAAAVAALVIWAGTEGGSTAGKATLVPAAPPSASPGSARIVGITKPIVLAGGALRLDPAGAPPASTASYQRLLAADQPTPYGPPDAPTQLLYGAFTHDTAGLIGQPIGTPKPTAFNHHPAVWIVDHESVSESGKPVPVTAYTALDPVKAKVLFSWTIDGPPPPSAAPVSFPDLSPGPSVVAPQTGIVDQGGQFHAYYWQGTNGWINQVGPNSYLAVYAGGEPVDPSLERTDSTLAGVLVLTPAEQLTRPAMSDGTRYLPSPAPTGKFHIIAVHGAVLTLQLVGTSQTYTFNTNTNTYG